MSGLCRYSAALGEPGTGAHSVRLGGLAAVDLLGTAGLAYLISRYGRGPGRRDRWSFVLVFVILVILAIVVHEVFCVNTRLNAAVFGREWPPMTHPHV